MNFIRILLVILIATPTPVLAQSVPVPQSKKEVLGDLDKRLKRYQSEEKKLKKNAKGLGSSISSTKKRLVDIAKSIQKNETSLQALENDITALDKDRSGIQSDLENDRAAIAKLIIALERIRRVPPEAMIARPDAPIKTARSAMLMQDILPALRKQSDDLKGKLRDLKRIEEDLKTKRGDVIARSKALGDEKNDLERLVKEREQLFAAVNKDLKQRQKQVSRISKESRNLSDLVKKLEVERTRNYAAQRKTEKAAPAAKAQKASIAAALPSPGKAQLPLRGIIRTGYNEKDSFGAKSKGITIEGRSGALIVAPMGGVIRFAGYFKNYGNMVILEHKNGYHSLIAGLEKIDTVVDQSISAGEPLGTLYKTKTGKAPTLYFELRYKGKAVNPANQLNLG